MIILSISRKILFVIPFECQWNIIIIINASSTHNYENYNINEASEVSTKTRFLSYIYINQKVSITIILILDFKISLEIFESI